MEKDTIVKFDSPVDWKEIIDIFEINEYIAICYGDFTSNVHAFRIKSSALPAVSKALKSKNISYSVKSLN